MRWGILGRAIGLLRLRGKNRRIHPASSTNMTLLDDMKAHMEAWTTFRIVSLEHWLRLCDKAEVESVPATHITSIPVALLKRFDSTFGEDPYEQDAWVHLQSYYSLMEIASKEGYMLRWDHCSSWDVKGRLGNGQPEWHKKFARLSPDDPRMQEFLWSYPGDVVPVYRRPWIKARIYEDYPVEYRVFVQDGEVQGVSNYYVQRDLPQTPEVLEEVNQVRHLTRQMIDHFPEEATIRQGDGEIETLSFTADWIVDEGGDVMFLEGGPPAGRGGHPCCFKSGEIDGIALADRN